MTAIAKILSSTLALSLVGFPLVGGTALAATTPVSQTTTATETHDRVDRAALDAFHAVLDRMVDEGRMTAAQKDAVVDAARRAGWDGFLVRRLNAILERVQDRGVITKAQRDEIVDAVAHADRNTDRLATVLDRLTDRGVLSRDQRDDVIDAAHRADWDGFSIERLGDVLGTLVRNGSLSAAQRDAIMDGMTSK